MSPPYLEHHCDIPASVHRLGSSFLELPVEGPVNVSGAGGECDAANLEVVVSRRHTDDVLSTNLSDTSCKGSIRSIPPATCSDRVCYQSII